MIRQVADTIRLHALLRPEKSYLVALSGGADSVALLLALRELGYGLEAAHCNFSLRGEESERDEAFCHTLCRRLGIPLHTIRFATRDEAARTGESIEMAARRLRYGWFRQLVTERDLTAVCVAHHRDDNAETLLLNLLRGTGPAGMAGMAYATQGIVRPLLDLSRADILAYLTERGQDFIVDSTNADTHYLRNAVRHRLLPLLRELRPNIDTALRRTAHDMRAARTTLDEAYAAWRETHRRQERHGASFAVEALRHPYFGHRVAEEYALPDEAFARLCEAATADGALLEGNGHTACRYRGRIEIMPQIGEEGEQILCTDRPIETAAGTLRLELMPREALKAIPREPKCVALDLDCTDGSLCVRTPYPGERFAPFGLRGTQLVSDYLTNCRLSRLSRSRERVVADRRGILWIVGRRPDRRAIVTGATRRVAVITLSRS